MKNRMNILNVMIIMVGFNLMACGKQITQFVGKGRLPSSEETTPQFPVVNGSQEGITLSPGAGYMGGGQVEGHVSLSPNRQTLKGSQVEAHMSLNRNRTQ